MFICHISATHWTCTNICMWSYTECAASCITLLLKSAAILYYTGFLSTCVQQIPRGPQGASKFQCVQWLRINVVHVTCHLAELKLFWLAVLTRHALAQPGPRKFEASAPWARLGVCHPSLELPCGPQREKGWKPLL